MVTRVYTAIFRREGDWWAGFSPEVPGAHTQGRTLEEARENLREAIALVLEANREFAMAEIGDAPIVREELSVGVTA